MHEGISTHAAPAQEQSRAGAQPGVRRLPASQQAAAAQVADISPVCHLPKPADSPLTRQLLREAVRRQHGFADIAHALGVTADFLQQVFNGRRQPKNCTEAFFLACGRYLGVPPVLAMLWAGRITMASFQWPTRSRRQEVQQGLQTLRDDPAVAGWIPAAVFSAEESVQDFIWSLYLESSGMHTEGLRMMPIALDYLQEAALSVAEFEGKVAEMRAQVAAA